jgi:Na+/proline symporter
VINVLQLFILKDLGVSFEVTTFVILLMILLYTFEGGVKTIVFTDTLQTTFMLLGLVVCIFYVSDASFSSTLQQLQDQDLTRIFNTDVNSPSHFVKHILGGAFITVAMTGLDQEMMQKNISVRTLRDSQKNMLVFSIILAVVNFLFLFLGGLLYLFAAEKGINVPADDLFPTIALNYLPSGVAIIFIIGLISALFPSADGALTALTSSFCIDILGIKRREDLDEKSRKKIRLTVHFIMAVIFFLLVVGFKIINNKSIIDVILKVAGFTYGPLLGLFAFGILTKRVINDRLSLIVCLLAPTIILGIDFINNIDWWIKQLRLEADSMDGVRALSESLFGSFKIGYELLIYNGILTFIGLWFISKKQK